LRHASVDDAERYAASAKAVPDDSGDLDLVYLVDRDG
jgi:hypothetical protein